MSGKVVKNYDDDNREEITFFKNLDESVLNAYKDSLVENMHSINVKKEAVKNIQAEIKELNGVNKQLVEKCKMGGEQTTGVYAFIDNDETNEREYIDSNGEVVHTKRIPPSYQLRTAYLKEA